MENNNYINNQHMNLLVNKLPSNKHILEILE